MAYWRTKTGNKLVHPTRNVVSASADVVSLFGRSDQAPGDSEVQGHGHSEVSHHHNRDPKDVQNCVLTVLGFAWTHRGHSLATVTLIWA